MIFVLIDLDFCDLRCLSIQIPERQGTAMLLVSWLRSGFVVVHRELSGETCPVDPTKNQLGQGVQDAGVYLKMLCLNIFKETFKGGWIGRGKLPCEG